MKQSSIWGIFCFLWILFVGGCAQDNEAIPKLAGLEAFESGAEEQFIGNAVDYSIPKLDILFVIDESGSMHKYQQGLAANIDMFLDEIRRIDRLSYRIAVVTSGPAGGEVYRHPNGTVATNSPPLGVFHKPEPSEPDFITNTTRDGMLLLKERLMPGIKGQGMEKFFEPLLNALTIPSQEDFVREDAYLAVFFLTDAEDPGNFIDAKSLYERILTIKNGDPKKVMAYGAVIPSDVLKLPSGCTRDDQGEPVNIEDFIQRTGGKIFDLCSSNYGVELARVGRELGAAVGTASKLNEVPAPESIRVYAGSREIPNDPYIGWVYMPETNEITFGDAIEIKEDEKIKVTYTRANEFRQ